MKNLDVLERALECFAEPAKRQEYFDLYSEDVVVHGYQGVRPGLDSVKQFYRVFWEVFPDARVEVEEVIEASGLLVVRHLTTGSQQGVFMGIAPKGKAIRLPGISILHFRGGRCCERGVASDSLLLLTQIGGFSLGRP